MKDSRERKGHVLKMDKEHWGTRGPKELGKALEKIMEMYISRKLFLRKYLNFTLTDILCTWEYWQ